MSAESEILQTRAEILRRLYDRYPRNSDHLILDRRRVSAGMTKRGGLTRASAEAIGILERGAPWSLPPGWRRALEGTVVPADAYRAYVRGTSKVAKRTKRSRKRRDRSRH